MKRGMSLSLCIKDIIEGRMPLSEVLSITTSTNAPTDERWERVLEYYAQDYWYRNPELAKSIANTLRAEGRIWQPRTEGVQPPCEYRGTEIWVEVDPYFEGITNRAGS